MSVRKRNAHFYQGRRRVNDNSPTSAAYKPAARNGGCWETDEVVEKPTSDLSASNRPRWLSAAALIAMGLFAGCLGTGVAWAYANANSVSSA